MLPSAELKPAYDSVVWLWNNRTFKGEEADKAAERAEIRYGMSSYPNLVFIDASSQTVMEATGRDTKSILASARTACSRVGRPDPSVAALDARMKKARKLLGEKRLSEARTELGKLAKESDLFDFGNEARQLLRGMGGAPERALSERLADPDAYERALALEELTASSGRATATVWPKAAALLEDTDELVRFRALSYLKEVDRGQLVRRAGALLKVANDPFRYELLEALADAADPAAAGAITEVYKKAGAAYPSRNPNVLRARAAAALGACGGVEAIQTLRARASSGEFLNSTTSVCVDAITRIGSRTGPAGKLAAAQVLLDCFPKVTDEGSVRFGRTLAEKVHGGLVLLADREAAPFPASWSTASRDALVAAWRRRVGVK